METGRQRFGKVIARTTPELCGLLRNLEPVRVNAILRVTC
jgi:hypothetical protein